MLSPRSVALEWPATGLASGFEAELRRLPNGYFEPILERVNAVEAPARAAAFLVPVRTTCRAD